jgi:type IV secretory pathway VirD2 relaxase
MAEQRDDMFRVKPRAPRAPGASVERRFLSRVKMEVSKLGGSAGGKLVGSRGRGGKRGRGQTLARLMEANQGPRARRVVIKTRLVVFKQAGRRSAATHLRYIERDGVGRDGQPGQAYSADSDAADVKAFEERSQGDRHQFRFIVAPEDAVDLDDLRDFTRHLMGQMERDLGTRLEWVAVDHWDTDNPHTHVVLRGKDQARENLVIGREYISHGMRIRAGELATSWLGARTDREIQASLHRDVERDRFTELDRSLQQRIGPAGVIDIRVPDTVDGLRRRALLIGRLQYLETLRLARQVDVGQWQLRDDLEPVLRSLGERRDIIRTMQRAFGDERRELVIAPSADSAPITGRIAAKGLSGEEHDKPYLVVDGLDGRAHHVSLPKTAELSDLPVGGIVEVRQVRDSIADHNIAAITQNGLYVVSAHRRALQVKGCDSGRARELVDAHIRRLEALRRAKIVERVADGLWRVPADLVDQGKAYDQKRLGGIELEVHSTLPIEKQVRAVGATWLDRKLVAGGASTLVTGFGAATRQAIIQRVDFLVEQGVAERRGNRAHVVPGLLDKLRDREIADVAQRIHRQTGLVHRPVKDGSRVSGVYRQSLSLASGRFAMLSDGMGFELVPWRPVIEQSLGKRISAVVRGSEVTWELGRQRGISI